MSWKYSNTLAEITAAFPTSAYTPRGFANAETGLSPITENITVPATPDAGGRYRVELSNLIARQASVAVTVNSVLLSNIAYGVAPTAGQCAISFVDVPILEFHSSLAGLTGTCAYTPLGSPLSASRLNQLEKEIAALGTGALAFASTTAATITLNGDVTGTPSENCSLIVERGTSTNAAVTWDETGDVWKAGLAGSEVQLVTITGTPSLTLSGTSGAILSATGATSTSAYVELGTTGRVFSDATSTWLHNSTYYQFGPSGSQLFYKSDDGMLSRNDANFILGTDSPGQAHITMAYNATAANRTTTLDAPTTAYTTAADKVPLTVKGYSSQSANLQEWNVNGAAAVATVDASGNIKSNKVGLSHNVSTTNYSGIVIDCQKDAGNTIAVGDWVMADNANAITSGKPFVERNDAMNNNIVMGVAVAVATNEIKVCIFGVCQAKLSGGVTLGTAIYCNGNGTSQNYYAGGALGTNGLENQVGIALEGNTSGDNLKTVFVQPKTAYGF